MEDDLKKKRRKDMEQSIGKKPTVEITIFEPAICCSSGGRGPAPDGNLRFSETIKMIEKKYGPNVSITRGSTNRNSSLIFSNQDILMIINEEGMQTLPITKINGNIVCKSAYPTFEMLDKKIKSTMVEEKSQDREISRKGGL